MSDRIINQGFVMCAGLGTRMMPLTDNKPKPMVGIAGKPLIDHILDDFQDFGITKTVINTHYKADVLEEHLGHRKQPEIIISREEELLNTGGGLKKALHQFDGKDFFVVNGDAFFDQSATHSTLSFIQDHWNSDIMDILLLLEPVEHMVLTQGVGDYDLNDEGQATRSLDKTGKYMFTSLRINKSNIFGNTPDGAFNYRDLMDEAQAKGRLYGVVNPGTWHHISTPEDLHAVNHALSTSKKSA